MIIYGVKPETICQQINYETLEAHAEEAAFLCFQRGVLLARHDVVMDDLKEHDRYLMANLEGLLLSAEAAWKICVQLIDEGDEYLFAPAYLAISTNNTGWLNRIYSNITPQNKSAVIMALGFAEWQHARSTLGRFLSFDDDESKVLVIWAVTILQQKLPDPKAFLQFSNPQIIAKILRYIGELQEKALMPILLSYLHHPNKRLQFWAARSLLLLDESVAEASAVLKKFIHSKYSPFQQEALRCVMGKASPPEQMRIFELLRNTPTTELLAIQCAGIMGDIRLLPYVISKMKEADLCKHAGQAFELITGVDLDYEDLVEEDSAEEELDEENETIDDDIDEPLDSSDWPTPSAELIKAWFTEHQSNFDPNQRYLAGKIINRENLKHILQTERMPHRKAAALMLALNYSKRMFNVQAPYKTQAELMSIGA